MKFLITGAGPVGRAVARELTARGHECIIMSRHGSVLDLGPYVQHITGDATQKEFYPADVDGIVHCIHAAYNAEAWRTLLIPAEDTALRIAAERGRQTRPELKLGICGEHGGDPASIHFCENADLDYVSCSPFRVPIARLAAAQATLAARAEEGQVASNVAFIPVRGSVGR